MTTSGVQSFKILDDVYSDNSGNLTADIYEGWMGVTGENGCVVFEDVPYGTYTVDEILKDGWENVSGLGETPVNEPTETFTVVNQEEGGGGNEDEEQIIVVKQSNLQGWGHAPEGGDATGSFTDGPLTPPRGTGSFQMLLDDGTDSYILGLGEYLGVRLADIVELSYETFVDLASPGTVQTIALQFNIDENVTDADNAWKSRLVYEPYQSGETITKGVWQEWSPLTGEWWASPNANSPLDELCPQSDPCTLAEILSAYPDAGIHPTAGAVIFKAGSGWAPGFTGSVDDFVIKTAGMRTIYDFEPETAQITIDKVLRDNEGNPDEAFSFDLSWLGDNLTLSANSAPATYTVPAGTYTIREEKDPNDDYDLSDIECDTKAVEEDPENDEVEVTLQSGDDVTCTFENWYDPDSNGDDDPQIIVRKITIPDTDEVFEFDVSWDNENIFLGNGMEDTKDLSSLLPGGNPFSVAEVNIPAGWELTSAECVSNLQGDTSTPESIELEDGEIITCTFTNEQTGITTSDDDGNRSSSSRRRGGSSSSGGEVLGEQISLIPTGAPATGFGGLSMCLN